MPSPNEITGEFRTTEGDYSSLKIAAQKAAMHVYGCGGDTPYTFQQARKAIADQLRSATRIHRGTWQTLDVSGSDLHVTRELMNYALFYTVPETRSQLIEEVQPDLPWAEEHFQERVSGEPLNPAPSHVRWPYASNGNSQHITDKVFDHTYPERFWPKYAWRNTQDMRDSELAFPMSGIRFEYGDLDDVVRQLVANPYTRQAYLPVWFPEDTGATNYRVPCTIGYHFMCDENLRLHMWYYLRACDFVRHFHNDVFFAAALLQWVCGQVWGRQGGADFRPGNLNMTISSLHVFEGDMGRLP